MTQNKTVALYYDPWSQNKPGSTGWLSIFSSRFMKAVRSKSNPRDEAYMRDLLDQRYPDAELVRYGEACDNNKFQQADKLVLLYPDAIGLGFGSLEKEIFDLIDEATELHILNGRRRDFLLDKKVYRSLRLRRFLEKSMLGEFAFTLVFIAVTPFFLVIDWMRGRT